MGRRTFGSIRKLPSGRWQARWKDDTWVEHRAPTTFRTRAEAGAWLDRVAVDRQRGQWVDPVHGRELLAEFAAEWLATTAHLRASTRARDEGYLRRYILPTFGARPIGAITHMEVRQWVARLQASGLAPATVVKAAQILGKVMATAVAAHKITGSPCAGVELPTVDEHEMRVLDHDDIDALAAAIDARYRGLVLLGCYGGLRASELFGLQGRRVNQLRRRVEVAEIVVDVAGQVHAGAPKTRAGRRVVPIPGFVADELGVHLAGKSPQELVFPAPAGGIVRLNTWRARFWVPATAQAGLAPLRIHDMRHTAVSQWIRSGATPKEVAVWAGHRSVATVLDRYGHLFPGAEDRVTAAIEAGRQAR